MKPLKTLLGGVILLEHPCFEDTRGTFQVLFEAEAAVAAGLPSTFVQDNASLSRPAGTVRGLHLQLPPWQQGKLLRVTRGRVVDVFVDLRPGSATRGQHETIELSAADDRQLWIPPGFAHGFCTLEPDTEIAYKVDAPYQPEAEWTLAWDDPSLAVDWPVAAADAVLSDKDRLGRSLGDTIEVIDQSVAALAEAPRTEAAGTEVDGDEQDHNDG
ncbi:MAG: dTDP-4-dehydrorhamnose 3,5-epimerase [Actinomycetota bacterium]